MDGLNDWGSGFVLGSVTVTNNGSTAVSGWSAALVFDQAVSISNAWSVQLTSTSGITITGDAVGYNATLQPGQSATFGMQGAPGNVALPECSVD